ncbi:MAG: zinc ribbon domain-containing protein [Candidatus Omnitrophica bacterium]|nr:zinc ribbon domain-containing protein [Candidatus Omnitrophota bacterium]
MMKSILILLSLFPLAVGNIDFSLEQSKNADPQLGVILKQVSARILQTASKRPFKLHHLNDSLEKTSSAIEMMIYQKNPRGTIALLKQAKEDYADNAIAVLLEAIVMDHTGETEKANELYEEFLTQSRVLTNFEALFLKWGEFHELRKIIYQMLKKRGVSFAGKELEIKTKTPFRDFVSYVVNPAPEDRFMNILFILVLLLGGGTLAIGAFQGVDFGRPFARSLWNIYILFWFAYGLWIFDLVFGLPWGWSRFQIIPIFLTGFVVVFVGLDIISAWQEKWRPLEKGYRRCPHCRAPVIELMTECPECHEKFEMGI